MRTIAELRSEMYRAQDAKKRMQDGYAISWQSGWLYLDAADESRRREEYLKDRLHVVYCQGEK